MQRTGMFGLAVMSPLQHMRQASRIVVFVPDRNQMATKPQAATGSQNAEPKTAYSRRRIALTPTAVEALRVYRIRQKEERLRCGAAWDTTQNLVFPNAIGGLMIPHNLAKCDFKRILQSAGLLDLHFHCLRHTAATLLLRRGVHPKVVSEMLGYADISITLRVYAHVTPTMQQAAVDVMEHIFGSHAG